LKGRLTVALELAPSRERGRIADAIDEELAVEVVALVLEGPSREPLDLEVEVVAVPVPGSHANVRVAQHLAPQIRNAEAALVIDELLVADELEHRVHEDGERPVRLVRVAGIVLDLDRDDSNRSIHLIGRQARTVGIAHRLDEIVDEGLRLLPSELLARDLARHLTQHRMPNRRNLENAHRRVPIRVRRAEGKNA